MALELRCIEVDEHRQFVGCNSTAFGFVRPDEELDRIWAQSGLDPSRTVAAFDGADLVGSAASFPLELTLPGQGLITVAGISWVGVRPTHRRRGILSAMMERQLADAEAAGEKLALLGVSEGGIYGRFGYGPATWVSHVEMTRHQAHVTAPHEAVGSLHLVTQTEATEAFPLVHDRARRARPGDVSRLPTWWDAYLDSREQPDHGPNGLFYLVHADPSGTIDGYAYYRIQRADGDDTVPGVVLVEELCAENEEASAALWTFLCDVDLTDKVVARHRPTDEPLRWMLAHTRQLRLTGGRDLTWVRLIDLPGCLTQRHYRGEGSVILDVTDASRPENSRRWRLEVGPGGADCSPAPAGAPTDLALGVAELGSVYLGGVSWSSLARGGRVHEAQPGALARADVMFGWEPAPFCATEF
ncbi:MAG: GNAT family N-acetyltransferase [Acidimicrobiales bacterium]